MAATGPIRGCIAQLHRRNRQQRQPFQELIDSRTSLLQENVKQKADIKRLQVELDKQTIELSDLIETTGGSGPGKRCQKCLSMQDELLANIREKSQDKQQILDLKEEVKELQLTVEKVKGELQAAKNTCETQKEEIAGLHTRMSDQESTLNVSVEECANRTAELQKLKDDLHRLHAENEGYVKQIIAMKEAEAERYNEIHTMMEEIESKKRNASAESKRASSSGTISDAQQGSLREALRFGSTVPTAPKYTVIAHERSEVLALTHNQSGSMLLTGSDDRMVKLWDARNGTKMASLEGAVKAVQAVAFSGDGAFALGASGDMAVRVWSLKTSRIVSTLTGHTAKIYAATFTPDSKMIVSGGYDRMIKTWDVQRGLVSKSLGCTSSCNDVAITPAGDIIASVHLDSSIRLWDLRAAEFAHEVSGIHSQPITSICINPANPEQVLTNARDDSLSIVDIRRYDSVRKLSHSSYKNGVNHNRACFSPDGQYVAAGGLDGSVTFWNAESGAHISTLKTGHKSAVAGCSWGDNDQFASVEKEHRLVLWG